MRSMYVYLEVYEIEAENLNTEQKQKWLFDVHLLPLEMIDFSA